MAQADVSVEGIRKTYGDVNPSLTGTLNGAVNGDNITASYSTPASQFSDAGTYAITATLTDPNGRLSNYTVTNTSGTLTINPANAIISVQAGTTYRELWKNDLLEQPRVDIALAEAFDERRRRNSATVDRLVRLLGLALASLIVETAGLALAS